MKNGNKKRSGYTKISEHSIRKYKPVHERILVNFRIFNKLSAQALQLKLTDHIGEAVVWDREALIKDRYDKLLTETLAEYHKVLSYLQDTRGMLLRQEEENIDTVGELQEKIKELKGDREALIAKIEDYEFNHLFE